MFVGFRGYFIVYFPGLFVVNKSYMVINMGNSRLFVTFIMTSLIYSLFLYHTFTSALHLTKFTFMFIHTIVKINTNALKRLVINEILKD